MHKIKRTRHRSGLPIAFLFYLLALGYGAACAPQSKSVLSGSSRTFSGTGTFLLVAKISDKCLDIKNGSTENGGQIQQWSCYAGHNQVWRLIPAGGGVYQIRSFATGKCLDVEGSSKADGARIQQWACNGTSAQLFCIEETESGSYRIVSKASGKALDISGRSVDDGAWVQQWGISNASNQSFSLKPVASPKFVHSEGTRLVDEKGKDLYLKGVNLGNWLVWEGYLMMGDFNFRTHTQFLNSLSKVFGSAQRAAEFEKQWRLNYVDEKAIIDLQALGFNSVRVPFNYKLFWKDDKLSDDGFLYVDRLISYCRSRGIYVLLDMHGAPGYQNPGDHSDNINSNASQPRNSVKFWDGDNVKIASKIWRHIADRYKNEPVVWGYDLINEPVPQQGREFELLPSLIQMRNAIREVDQNHSIVAEGNWWGADLWKLDWNDNPTRSQSRVTSKWDHNLVYQIHHYGPAADAKGREDITNKLGIPLILGEFGESDNSNLLAINKWSKASLAGSFVWSFKKLSHDKTLWTIPTNEVYEKVKKSIISNSRASDDVYEGMLLFAKDNIRNGHTRHIWDQGFYNAVSPK